LWYGGLLATIGRTFFGRRCATLAHSWQGMASLG
jgi:hypothetical protein